MSIWIERLAELRAERIAKWILKTPLNELVQHVLDGVNLDSPPKKFFRPPPPVGQGGTPAATPQKNGTIRKG